jgi:hypothetical protein
MDILSIYTPSFFIFLGMSIISPILPLYAKSFNVSYTLARAGSGPVWTKVNEELQKHGGSISRASIIFSWNDLADQGVLTFELEFGKSGMHKIY